MAPSFITTKIVKTLLILFFNLLILFNATSCLVLVAQSQQQPKGWHKNTNNPHHPNSKNPGKSRGNHKK